MQGCNDISFGNSVIAFVTYGTNLSLVRVAFLSVSFLLDCMLVRPVCCDVSVLFTYISQCRCFLPPALQLVYLSALAVIHHFFFVCCMNSDVIVVSVCVWIFWVQLFVLLCTSVLGFFFSDGLKEGLKIFQTKYFGKCLTLRDVITKKMIKVL